MPGDMEQPAEILSWLTKWALLIETIFLSDSRKFTAAGIEPAFLIG